MIRKIEVTTDSERTVVICGLICCQNPTLNPAQLPAAVSHYLADLLPDHVTCERIEVYDNNENVFR